MPSQVPATILSCVFGRVNRGSVTRHYASSLPRPWVPSSSRLPWTPLLISSSSQISTAVWVGGFNFSSFYFLLFSFVSGVIFLCNSYTVVLFFRGYFSLSPFLKYFFLCLLCLFDSTFYPPPLPLFSVPLPQFLFLSFLSIKEIGSEGHCLTFRSCMWLWCAKMVMPTAVEV